VQKFGCKKEEKRKEKKKKKKKKKNSLHSLNAFEVKREI
jgi:hypothetical protein